MANRIAVTIAGAVSLGAFEAGVLFEVLDAIGQHNLASPEDSRLYVDVLTGASAGGMTAAIAAQKLLYSAGELAKPYDNVFYNAWVAGVDINGLLPLGPGESPSQSVLSSNFVRNLAEKLLLARYAELPVPSPSPHPALPLGGALRVGLALSNLNGVDFQRQLLSGGAFNYTEFADQITFTLDHMTDAEAAWAPVIDAALACGAFPFAFRPGDLSRDIKDFDPTFLAPWPRSPRVFTYTDGGVFQNQPIGLAKNLVDLIDKHQNSDTRSYLFVSPQGVDAKVSGITEATASFELMAGALFNAVYNQAGFRDWIEAESVNQAISLLNERAIQLRSLFLSGAIESSSIQGVVSMLLSQFRLKAEDLAKARNQLRAQFDSEYRELASTNGAPAADVWIDAVLLFELAADLHEKDEMYIYSITTDRKDLAGAGFSSFLGFLERAFRDHDYDLGREKAIAFLKNVKDMSQGKLPELQYSPQEPIRPVEPTPAGGFTAEMIPEESRKRLVDALSAAADNLLEQEKVSWVIRKSLESLYLNRKIKDALDLG